MMRFVSLTASYADYAGYLVATGIDIGLINFGKSVTVRRKFGTARKNPVNPENPVNLVLLEYCDKRSDE